MPQWIDVHGTPWSVVANQPTPRVAKQPRKPKPGTRRARKADKRRAHQGFMRLLGAPNANGCMEWQGVRRKDGYGVLFVGKRRVSAHRYSYQLHYGVTLDSLQLVCHKCDNPPCANPDHLFIGTHQDNVADMIAKGRAAWQRKVGEPLVPTVLSVPIQGVPRLVKKCQPAVPAVPE